MLTSNIIFKKNVINIFNVLTRGGYRNEQVWDWLAWGQSPSVRFGLRLASKFGQSMEIFSPAVF